CHAWLAVYSLPSRRSSDLHHGSTLSTFHLLLQLLHLLDGLLLILFGLGRFVLLQVLLALLLLIHDLLRLIFTRNVVSLIDLFAQLPQLFQLLAELLNFIL